MPFSDMAERLLALRTPSEIAVAPDGETVVLPVTLVTAGTLDPCTPVEQGHQLYAALVEAGAETELVIYPREGHIVVEREHALGQIRRTTDWFERFLSPGV